MKKIITAVVLVGMVLPVFSFAQTAQAAQGTNLQTLLKQVIALLEQEVAQLETQLASMNASSSAMTTSLTAISSSTTTTGATSVTVIVAPSSTAATAGITSNSTSGISTTLISQAGKMPFQELGAIALDASQSGPIELGSLKLTFSGNGYTAGSSTFLDTVVLRDPNAVDVATSFGAVVTRDANAGTITWTFPTSVANPAVISSGERLTLQLWGTTNVIPGMAGTAESLSAAVAGSNDLTFYDGADPAAIAMGSIPISITAVPIKVASFSWGVGM